MTLNNKIDDFKFNEMFSKKIDNLENIINLYIESPKESLQNLSDIYNNYQTFLINKKKKEAREAEKRGYRMKYEQKIKMTETEEVPKSQRILNSGGLIFNGRVAGQLMLSRSFGDWAIKQYGVIVDPHVTKIELNDDDLFCVIASDGIWDVIKDDDCSVLAHMKFNTGDLFR